MLKLIRRIIPDYAHLPLTGCAVTLMLAYSLTKLIDIFPTVDIALGIDAMIAVRPAWVVVYILSYIYWTIGYIAIARIGKKSCKRLTTADFIAKVICAAFFVLMPTEIERPVLTGGGFEWLLSMIYTLDTPDNLFPSMHCLFSWLVARQVMESDSFGRMQKLCAVVFSVLVFASTLFTRQHYVVDIFGGMAVAEIAIFAAKMLEKYRYRGAEE